MGWECDYNREAHSTIQFRDFVKDKKGLNVPRVHTKLSTSKVITTDWVEGMPLGEVVHLSQARRNHIAERMLRLCLDELFVYRFMQTDPNWTNFLYNIEKDTVCCFSL